MSENVKTNAKMNCAGEFSLKSQRFNRAMNASEIQKKRRFELNEEARTKCRHECRIYCTRQHVQYCQRITWFNQFDVTFIFGMCPNSFKPELLATCKYLCVQPIWFHPHSSFVMHATIANRTVDESTLYSFPSYRNEIKC